MKRICSHRGRMDMRNKLISIFAAIVFAMLCHDNCAYAFELVQLNDSMGVDELMASTNNELVKAYRKVQRKPVLQIVRYELESSNEYSDEYVIYTNNPYVRMFAEVNEHGCISMLRVACVGENTKKLLDGKGILLDTGLLNICALISLGAPSKASGDTSLKALELMLKSKNMQSLAITDFWCAEMNRRYMVGAHVQKYPDSWDRFEFVITAGER